MNVVNHYQYRQLSGTPMIVETAPIDYEKTRKYFAFQPIDVVKKTFENSTQHYRKSEINPTQGISTLGKHYKSPFPAHNHPRINEDIAADTVFSETPAVDGGQISAQLFVGCSSGLCDAYGMKNEKQFVNTLQDNIRERGAPTRLISDSAQVEISSRVKDILRYLMIGSWNSEPHQQHQNPVEKNKILSRGL